MNEIEVARLNKRISNLEQQVLEVTKRLDNLDAKNKEAIQRFFQAIAHTPYENGEDHL
jgi:hypothetical protein